MAVPIDPTGVAFLTAETRAMPMHVAGLSIYAKPEGAGEDYVRSVYQDMIGVDEVAPVFGKRPERSLKTAGQWVWVPDDGIDLEYHVRHNALPRPGRIRELLELSSRLHGQRLARDRPLWEAHVIEGLDDGTFATYLKLHHSVVDGIAAMRLLQSMMSTDPDDRRPAVWAKRPARARSKGRGLEQGADGPAITAAVSAAMTSALSVASDAAGLPAALVRTLAKGVRNETSAISLYAPKSMFNTTITGSRRFAAQGWPLERLRAVAKSTRTTLNDVVLAMCSGAIRAYLLDLDALPETSLVSMVPVGLNAKSVNDASDKGGNAVGSVMVRLGTDLADPAARLRSIHESMREGKQALESMSPTQIVAMSALGMAPSIAVPMLRLQGVVRPPFNLIISNVPGPRKPLYMNGARMLGSYPLSIPMQGMALNITCNSYADDMEFGLTGCRRTVPHLQRLLAHLDDELASLEKAADV